MVLLSLARDSDSWIWREARRTLDIGFVEVGEFGTNGEVSFFDLFLSVKNEWIVSGWVSQKSWFCVMGLVDSKFGFLVDGLDAMVV